MTKYEKIKNIIREYHAQADKIFQAYCQKEAWARNEYKEESFKSHMRIDIYPEFYGKVHGAADVAINEIDGLFKEIRKEFDQWVVKPIDHDLLMTLNCIQEFGLSLSLSELKIIEQSVAGSYLGSRVFAGLTKNNGYAVEIMNADSFHKALESAQNNAHFAIQAYAGGEGMPGQDLLDTNKYHGIDYGEYTVQDMWTAFNFTRDGGEIDRLEKMWGDASAPMRYQLTQSEEERIKTKIEKILDSNGEVMENEAAKLVKEEPDIASKLDSLASDYEGKYAVEKYFGISNGAIGDAVAQSKILEAAAGAADYTASRGKVDAELLKQFT